MSIKTVWYELAPYLYTVIGIATILSRGSSFGLLCGAILVAVSSVILTLRWTHRQKPAAPVRRRRT